jgi:hypothetical protein
MRWAALAFLVLADVAPSGSCGNSRPTRLSLTLSDCSCAAGDVSISVDEAATFPSVRCPFSSPPVSVTPGRHVVRATSGGVSWSRTVDAVDGRTTAVELGCPAR